MSLTVTPDLASIPHGDRARRYLLVTVIAPAVPRSTERRPVHLSLVLDRSGSMSGDKMVNVRKAAISALQRLDTEDRFSVVVYDDRVDVIVPSTLASPQARREAATALEKVDARGTTDLSTGWLRGCEQVGLHLPSTAVGRVLLLTDGLANRGIQSVEALEQHASALRARGVTTSTFGVGADFNEVLLRKMSTAGGGNFYFIETPQQIEDFITSETGEALEVVAREARLTIDLPSGARAKCLSAMPVDKDGQKGTIQLGGLVSDQEVHVLLRIDVPDDGRDCTLRLHASDLDGALSKDVVEIVLPRSNAAAEKDARVASMVVSTLASRGRMKALEQLQGGDAAKARATLADTIRRVSEYGIEMAGIDEVVQSLEEERRGLDDMSPTDRKRMYLQSVSSGRGRSSEGFANKTMLGEVRMVVAVPQMTSELTAAAKVCRGLLKCRLETMNVAPIAGDTLAPDAERTLVRAHAVNPTPLRMTFITQRLSDNWFSHWHEAERTAIVSVVDVPSSLLAAFAAYEVVFHGLRLLSPRYDPHRIIHAETRGCLFDLCQQRADLEIKLQTADLCAVCSEALTDCGIAPREVRQACDFIRAVATTPQTI